MQASREAVLLLRSALGAARLASSNATKVVLQQDVAKVGYAGEMVDVSKGFARNYLLPQRLASIVPKAKGKDAAGEAEAASTAPQREEVMDEAAEAKEAVRLLTASPLIIRAAVSRKTKKIMPIGRKQILAHILDKKKVALSKESLVIAQPIPALGDYKVPLRFDSSVVEGGPFHLAVKVLRKV